MIFAVFVAFRVKQDRRVQTILNSLIGRLPFLLGVALLCAGTLAAQLPQLPNPGSQHPKSTKNEVQHDPLGRTTPRGTVLGFLSAARHGDYQYAAQYLETQSGGKSAALLARQLFVVLDRALPAHLEQLSNEPDQVPLYEGNKNKTLVGTISSDNGDVDVLLEHVESRQDGPIWLFSKKTLESVPRLYEELSAAYPDDVLPEFAVDTRIAGIPLFEWLAVILGIPALYFLGVLFSRVLRLLVSALFRAFGTPGLAAFSFPAQPFSLLFVAFVLRWLLDRVHLSLLARQFWASLANVLIVVSCVWLLIFASELVETYIRRHLRSRNLVASSTLLRLARRIVDAVIVFVGLIALLRYFGVNATAALAGLGVGGIAVALATQKTLENLIGGISILSDDAVRVGDLLKVGDTLGTVEDISLRSTRIRALDRTLVNVPNGQLSDMSISTLSLRDKFALNPVFGLRYGTAAPEVHRAMVEIHDRLAQYPEIEAGSIRVRFLRFGRSSLDVEVLAYVTARNLDHFLEIQGKLLIGIMEAVEAAGTQIAIPSQAVFVSPSDAEGDRPGEAKNLETTNRADQRASGRAVSARRAS